MPGTTKTRKTILLIVLIALVVLAIVFVILWHGRARPEPVIPSVTPRPTAEVVIREKEVEKIVEVEKEITTDMLRDGLNDMGVLVTEEYYFTEVVSFSSIKTFLHVELGITESSYLAGYDGVVTAGIDFTKVTVEKIEEQRTIRVTMPRAEIRNVDIDPESFELYSEKTGLGNPISVEDFNQSLVELEKTASAKAVERGILDRASANAETVIRNFILGMVGPDAYQIRVETAA